jgi:hypothetical protein
VPSSSWISIFYYFWIPKLVSSSSTSLDGLPPAFVRIALHALGSWPGGVRTKLYNKALLKCGSCYRQSRGQGALFAHGWSPSALVVAKLGKRVDNSREHKEASYYDLIMVAVCSFFYSEPLRMLMGYCLCWGSSCGGTIESGSGTRGNSKEDEKEGCHVSPTC